MFLVFGESLIDMVAGPTGDFTPVPGGGPYNFARALALQGLAAGYLNPFSEDAFGRLLKTTLASSGARHLGRMSHKPTSLALVATDARGQPQYSFYRDNVADRDIDSDLVLANAGADVTGFHSGTLALVPPDDRHVLRAMQHFQACGVLCTLDVNMRPQVAGSMGIALEGYRAAAFEAVAHADVVKVSDEDLRNLGLEAAPQAGGQALLERGCRLVVVTVGAQGAWAIDARYRLHQPAFPVRAVDTVGAGDCFFAGFVASLERQGALDSLRSAGPTAEVLSSALRHAAVCAAIDISRKGCQPPTWEEAVRWQPSAA